MRIMNNVSALNAWRNLTSTDGSLGKNLERLSSGFRINRAADDVAGLAISENMRAQIRGFNQAVRNAQDGISLVQTAEGSLNETHTMLQRMRELAVQAANGTLQPGDRDQIQTEMDNLTTEITRITNASKFNNKDLIDGSLSAGAIGDVTLQIGPNGGQSMTLGIGAMDAKSLGIGRDVLTGSVDNGTAVYTLGSNKIVAGAATTGITSWGQGIVNGAYKIVSDASNNLTLQTNSGTVIGSAVTNAAGGQVVTLGDAASGQTVTFATVAPGGANTDTLTVASMSNSVQSVNGLGAGMTGGNFKVLFDAGTKTLQLQDANGVNIGGTVDVTSSAGKEVVLGDVNTARTMKVTVGAFLPTANQTDLVKVGSQVGEVLTDPAAANAILNNTASGAVSNVGTGLVSGKYSVAFAGANVQLQDSAGNAIGSAQAFVAGGTVTLGDAATNRTVQLKLAAATPGVAGSATILINNDGKAALAASFSGGVKRVSAQVFAGLNVSSVTGASDALKVIDDAIGKVSEQRAQLGAVQNRLEHTINNLQVVSENLVASESRIRDVDMAQEMSQFTKHQILMQAGTAMLAQANAKNQAVLSLLK